MSEKQRPFIFSVYISPDGTVLGPDEIPGPAEGRDMVVVMVPDLPYDSFYPVEFARREFWWPAPLPRERWAAAAREILAREAEKAK